MLIQPPAQTANPIIFTRPRYFVKTAATWGSDWVLSNYLECLEVTESAPPSFSRASFRFRAGKIKREDSNVIGNFPPMKSLVGTFVQVWIVPNNQVVGAGGAWVLWTGFFDETSMIPAGTDQGTQADQTFVAYGMEKQLDRVPITGAYATNDDSNFFPVATDIAFNEQYVRGLRPLGNRSNNPIPADALHAAYGFAADANAYVAGVPWSVLDIVNYLIYFFANPALNFNIVVGGQTDAIANIVLPRVATGNHTVWGILNAIIDRRMGLGWCMRTSGTGNVELHIFTVFDTAVAFNGVNIAPNGETHTIVLDNAGALVHEMEVSHDANSQYGEVRVYGEPAIACFSLSFNDGTLAEGWLPADEADYLSAVSATDAPNNDRYRGGQKLSRVYTTFKAVLDSQWHVGDGTGNIVGPASPYFTDAGKAAFPCPSRTWGHVLMRTLPLPNKGGLEPAETDNIKEEYQSPSVWVWNDRAKVYEFAHATGLAKDEVAGGSVRMLDRDFGFEVKFSAAHVLGLHHFVTAGGDGGADAPNANTSSHIPEYDYKAIIATVATRTDSRLFVRATIPNAVTKAPLVIDVEDAEYWFIMPGTVLDLAAGGTLVHQSAGPGPGGITILRDDSKRLQGVAALAKTWYSKIRDTLTLTVNDIWPQYPIGSIIDAVSNKITTDSVNTVVSELHHDLQTMQTTIRTRYAELDFKSAAGTATKTTLR